MSLQIAAQHLATKGRGPDTELVHMTKGEIAGLQSLAVKMGGTLTINPDTGLAEAGFLRSILPMLAGMAANFIIPGSGALAGAATGYALNPKGGLGSIAMGALGGYGGGSLAGGFANAGAGALSAQAGAGLTEQAAQQAVASKLASAGPGELLQAGAGQVFSSPSSAMQFAKQNRMGIGALAAPILGGMAQPTLAGMTPQSTGNIRPFSFTRRANTDDPNNPTVDQYYTAGTPLEAPGPAGYPYQPGQTIRMAEGGTVGMMPQMIQGGSDVTSSSMPIYKFNRTIGGTAAEPTVDQYFTLVPPLETPAVATPGVMRDFDGGMGGDFDGGMGGGFDGGFIGTQDPAPVLNFDTYSSQAQLDADAAGQNVQGNDALSGFLAMNDNFGTTAPATTSFGSDFGPGDAPGGSSGADGGFGGQDGMANGGILQAYKRMAAGGISSLGSYSDGGRLLKGPGDGVSDNIPAVIGKRQPARLADGEFVLPARIVSEIGNGSTDAGARELYKMMARIQKNRSKTVGKDKVAVDAKSRKLLPA